MIVIYMAMASFFFGVPYYGGGKARREVRGDSFSMIREINTSCAVM